jgi:hypothetical protein
VETTGTKHVVARTLTEEILLLEEGATLPTTENGTLQFSIPYSHEKLYPGKWILAVNGGSGMHGHIFNVPDN